MDTFPPSLPETPLDRLLRPVHSFLSWQLAGSAMLVVPTLVALVWANSPWGETYAKLWHTPVSVGFGEAHFTLSLAHWINDGLMSVFFLLVGLEIKRELLVGELSSPRKAMLPIFAAAGGMLLPAGLYALLNARGPGAAGWGIPMATDIAFTLGVLTVLEASGRRVAAAVKVFVLATAIVDDLGAVVVIAGFYTPKIAIVPVLVAVALIGCLVALNVWRVHRPLPYLVVGAGLWGAMLASGIHATVAGVVLAMTIPASRAIDEPTFLKRVAGFLKAFEEEMHIEPTKITDRQGDTLHAMERSAQAVQTPLARMEHGLLFPVNFVILPLFALANAGVDVRQAGVAALGDPISWGVMAGLVLGKPAGVLLLSFVAIKAGLASLPAGASQRQLVGVAALCGIGFTMSLFVAGLAFGEEGGRLSAAKIGILAGSVVSAGAGGLLLWSRESQKK